MGIPILTGRTFATGEASDAVIINDVLARRLWGSLSPVGRRFRLDAGQPWWHVVGIVADVKQMGPSDPMGDGMEFYLPFSPRGRNNFFSLIIRSDGSRAADLQMAKQRVWELDDRQPIQKASTMDERLGESIARQRFSLTLATAFAGAAALLAAIGVYGVSTYWVSRRRRELAIRVALGASRHQLMSMVVGRSLRLATIGCVTGLGLALWGARAIESMLFQTSARDPLTFVLATGALGIVALLASSLAALKASRVDPMSVLRAE